MAIAPAATGSVSVIITAIDGATKTIEAVNARIAGLVKPARDTERALGRMSEAIGLDKLHERLVSVGEGFHKMTEGVTRSFERLGLVLLGGGGLLEGFRRIAEGAAEIGIQAKTIGLTVEQLSRLEFAAQQSGVSTDQLTTAMGRFSKNAVQAAISGSGDVAQAFRALHIPLLDASRHMRPLPDLLGEVAERFSHMPDDINKTYYATILFGKAGKALIPLLDRGKAGIADLSRAADLLGITLSTELAEHLHTVSTRMDILGDVALGLSRQLVGSLAPGMIELSNSILQFVVDNQSKIKEFFEDIGRGFTQFVKDLLNPTSQLRKHITEWVENFQWFGRKFNEFGEAVGGRWKIIAGIVGAWVFGPAIAGIGALTASLIAIVPALAEVAIGIGSLLLFTPVGWTIDAALAIGFLAYEIYRHWDNLGEWVRGIWKSVKDTIESIPVIGPTLKEFDRLFTGASDAAEGFAVFIAGAWALKVGAGLLKTTTGVEKVTTAITEATAATAKLSTGLSTLGSITVIAGSVLAILGTWAANNAANEKMYEAARKLGFEKQGGGLLDPVPTFVNPKTRETLTYPQMKERLGGPPASEQGGGYIERFFQRLFELNPPKPTMPPNAIPPLGPLFGPQRLPDTSPTTIAPAPLRPRLNPIAPSSFNVPRLDVGALAGGVTLASFMPSQPAVIAQQTGAAIGFFEWLRDAFTDTLADIGTALTGMTGGGSGGAWGGSSPGGDGPIVASPGGSGPRNMRNFNPGNLMWAPGEGAVGKDSSGFAIFKTMTEGVGAMVRQLQLYQQRGLVSVAQMISRWAPAGAGNDTGSYIANVARMLGVNPMARFDLSNPMLVAGLVAAMARIEGGVPDAGSIMAGVTQALRLNPPAIAQQAPPALSAAPPPLVQSGTPGAGQTPGPAQVHAPVTINVIGAHDPATTAHEVRLRFDEHIRQAERYARADLDD